MKDKVLLITPKVTNFVKIDIDFLSKKYNVDIYCDNWNNKKMTPFLMIKQFFKLLFNIKKYHCILIHFGGYWSFFPCLIAKWFSVKSFIVLHGTDSASIPVLRYGNLRKNPLRYCCYLSYKSCTKLLPVSGSLIETINVFDDELPKKQGVHSQFAKLKTDYETIHNGLNSNFWKKIKGIQKEKNRFLSVFSESQFRLKGGDLIINIAKHFPNDFFVFAGLNKPNTIKEIPGNVLFLGKLTKQELLVEYSRSKFYFQLSSFEGFGLALCEAMLCECIPIVSSNNFLPLIVKDVGFVLEKRNQNDLIQLVNKIKLKSNLVDLGKKSKEKIKKDFNLKQREIQLHKVLS